MKKRSSSYICSSCTHEEPKWLGRCPACGEWNTLKETSVQNNKSSANDKKSETFPVPLHALDPLESARISSGISEFDRVLGGGIMKGMTVLVGGEPGIGKSTLMLQVAVKNAFQGRVLYISGEESQGQLKLRADRLHLKRENLEVLCSGNLSRITSCIDTLKPQMIIIDSVQTLYTEDAGTVPGTINQMKYTTYELVDLAKEKGIAIFFIGHVTKEGTLAGPKAIEHMVDAVLYFEQSDSDLRIIRSVKNRFGSTDEVGLFSMQDNGLEEVKDPSALFLFERSGPAPSGVAIAPVFEGSRVLMVEIQALTVSAKGGLSRVYSEKIDSGRVARIAAVLEKHSGLRFSDQDIYVNVAGGIKLTEPAVDLALCAALYSARTALSLPEHSAIFGEVSLSGEIRTVPKMKVRAKTALSLGYKNIFGSGKNTDNDDKWTEAFSVSDFIKKCFK